MLDVKKLLAKLLSDMLIKTAEVSSPFGGVLQYIQFGEMVVISGYINTNTNVAHGTILATGLPPAGNNGLIMSNNNAVASYGYGYIDASGNLRQSGATSGNRSLRVCGAYIVGGVLRRIVNTLQSLTYKGVIVC